MPKNNENGKILDVWEGREIIRHGINTNQVHYTAREHIQYTYYSTLSISLICKASYYINSNCDVQKKIVYKYCIVTRTTDNEKKYIKTLEPTIKIRFHEPNSLLTLLNFQTHFEYICVENIQNK